MHQRRMTLKEFKHKLNSLATEARNLNHGVLRNMVIERAGKLIATHFDKSRARREEWKNYFLNAIDKNNNLEEAFGPASILAKLVPQNKYFVFMVELWGKTYWMKTEKTEDWISKTIGDSFIFKGYISKGPHPSVICGLDHGYQNVTEDWLVPSRN